MKHLTTIQIAVIAVMTAVVTVFTLAVRIPIPGTPGGYVNFSDVAVFFTAFAFGPWIGFIASAVGTALADLIGFPATAPLTFFAHGLEALVAALRNALRLAAGLEDFWARRFRPLVRESPRLCVQCLSRLRVRRKRHIPVRFRAQGASCTPLP